MAEFREYSKKKIIELIKSGAIFIYPTDTIYGIGCNAENKESVQKIREMKGRDAQKPLSIIAPSKQWIIENLEVEINFLDKYLPGPYTLILKKKNLDFLKHVSSSDTLGVRIPNHEFASLIAKAGVPFITTSVNLSGEKPASSIKEIKMKIISKADIIIDEGPLSRTPSTIITPEGKELKRA